MADVVIESLDITVELDGAGADEHFAGRSTGASRIGRLRRRRAGPTGGSPSRSG